LKAREISAGFTVLSTTKKGGEPKPCVLRENLKKNRNGERSPGYVKKEVLESKARDNFEDSKKRGGGKVDEVTGSRDLGQEGG